MIDELYDLVLGDNGFIIKLRCDNIFDENIFYKIKELLKKIISEWKSEEFVPKKGFLIIIELVEFLSRNSNFLTKEDFIKVEDASLEIKDIINDLYL